MKILDTFAGAGGFSLGFAQAGCKIIGAIELDRWAADTFSYNHPSANVLCGDIAAFKDSKLRQSFSENNKPDIVLGGPPCQGFSVCRKEAGDPKDPRNSMFMEFLRMAAIFEPQVVIMENVPNLIKAQTKSKKLVIEVIQEQLEELKYHVYYDVLEATQFGIPQMRKRLFVIASKQRLGNPFPTPTHEIVQERKRSLFSQRLSACPTLWNAISDLPPLQAGEGAEEMDYERPSLNQYQMLLRQGSNKLCNHRAMSHSKRIVERFATMQWGESVCDVPTHLKPYRRNSNQEISTTAYDQNNRRMHPDRPCHTVPASFYANFVHPYQDRNFTAREGARIQSFPDTFVFLGKPTVVSHKLLEREGRLAEKYLCQYSQIGNAVPPILAKAIADNLLSQIFFKENNAASWGQSKSEGSSPEQVFG